MFSETSSPFFETFHFSWSSSPFFPNFRGIFSPIWGWEKFPYTFGRHTDKLKKSICREEYRMLLERLKNMRKELEISHDNLSQIFGRTRTFVSKVESGERRLDVLELMHYLELLQIDPKRFLNEYFRGLKNVRS